MKLGTALGSALLVITLAACAGSSSEPELDPELGSASEDLTACANGRAEARDFNSPTEQAGIVQAANKESLQVLSIYLDADALAAFERTRAAGPFESVAQIGCVPGVGVAALKDLKDLSMMACGLGDARPANRNASPRSCAHWAATCGNDRFTPTHPDQRACQSPTPVGTFFRVITGEDKFPMLPREITFADKRHTSIYSSGVTLQGRAQQRDKKQVPDKLLSYMILFQDGTWDDPKSFFMRLSDDGLSLRLDPIFGAVGRDITAPTFKRR